MAIVTKAGGGRPPPRHRWVSGSRGTAGEDEVKLDLQWVFNQAYDRGPYRRGAVDYEGAPEPPLDPDDLQWVYQQLHEQGLRS